MAKKDLNGSDNLLGQAMRRVIEESMAPMEKRIHKRVARVKEDVKAVREDVASLKSDMESGFKDAAEERRRLRGDMESGFTELRPPEPLRQGRGGR